TVPGFHVPGFHTGFHPVSTVSTADAGSKGDLYALPRESKSGTRPRGGKQFRSLAGETVHLVDRTSVAVGDHGHHFAPVAGVGGAFYELAVDAGEELEILGVIDENVIGSGDRLGEEFAVGVAPCGLGERVRAHDE